MSTNSNIGFVQADGTVLAVYCHWDGHPSSVGSLLLENYTTARSVELLLAFGDISSLAATVEKSVFYRRDRDEIDVDAEVYPNGVTFMDTSNDRSHIEYVYLLLLDGTWVVNQLDLSVANAMIEENT